MPVDITTNEIAYLSRRISPLFNWQEYAKKCGHVEWSRHQSKLHYIKNTPADVILSDNIVINAYCKPTTDDLAICLCYFSYCRYKKPLNNLLTVLNDLNTANIPYFIIELLYPGQESIVPNPTKIVRANTVMFHKENLWNLIEKYVPDKYSKLLFLDADIRFTKQDWYDATSQLLDTYTVVQPMDLIHNNGTKYSICGALQYKCKNLSLWHHHPGHAIGINRTLFNDIGGFYDKAVIGSGDTIFWNCILKSTNNTSYSESQLAVHTRNYNFSTSFDRIKQNKDKITIGCVTNNTCVHLRHGTSKNRKYSTRSVDFPVQKYDLNINNYGVYEWANSSLNTYMQRYFWSRDEDSCTSIKYSDYVKQIDLWVWNTPVGAIVNNKRSNKQLAASLNIKTPKEIKQSCPYVFKPINQHSAKNVFLVTDTEQYIIEELISTKDGALSNTIFFYVFGNTVKFVQTSNILEMRDDNSCFKDRAYGYYSYPTWEPIKLETSCKWHDIKKPHLADNMATDAIKFAVALNQLNIDAGYAPIKVIRVDFLDTDDDYYFNETAVTPGLVVGKRLLPNFDTLLGSWL